MLATKFKRREDFKSDLEYKDYLINTMKPNMLVVCNKSSDWKPASGYYRRSHPRPKQINFQSENLKGRFEGTFPSVTD